MLVSMQRVRVRWPVVVAGVSAVCCLFLMVSIMMDKLPVRGGAGDSESAGVTVAELLDSAPRRPTSRHIPPRIDHTGRRYKVVLLTTPFYSDSRWGSLQPQGNAFFSSRKCAVNKCYLTTNESYTREAAALVFHGPDMFGEESVPVEVPLRSADQVAVLLTAQPPTRYVHNMQEYSGYFNWIMSYRTDSDIFTPVPFGNLAEPRRHQGKWRRAAAGSHGVNVAGKSRLVAYVAGSWCQSHSAREEYVQQLSKHVPVDTFGACGGKASPCDLTITPGRPTTCGECCDRIEERYHFLLAFEDSLCRDYISDLFYYWIFRDVVVVVLGRGPYSDFVPQSAYIDATTLSGPRHLANLLRDVAGNETAYRSYFTWREERRVWRPRGVYRRAGDPWCKLCERLHNVTATAAGKLRSTYDIAHWWIDKGDCRTVRSLFKHSEFIARD